MTGDRKDTADRPAEPRRNLPALFIWIGALLVLTALAAHIFSPFLGLIVSALVLTTIGYPLFEAVLRLIGPARRGIAAGITCLAIVLLVIVPVLWIGWSAVQQARAGIGQAAEIGLSLAKELDGQSWFARIKKAEWFQRYWDHIEKSLEAIGQDAGERPPPAGPEGPGPAPAAAPVAPAPVAPAPVAPAPVAPAPVAQEPVTNDIAGPLGKVVAGILSDALGFFLQFCLMVFILFNFLRDGPEILRSLQRALPLEARYQEVVIRNFRRVSRSVIWGSLGTAVAQGAVAALAFLVIGIPAVFWGAMVALCSLIPPLGTGIVLFPITVYLFAKGSWGQGIFLAVVLLGVSLLDNVLLPLLVGKDLQTHPIWLLLAILGGISAFGPLGIVYGPMVLVLLGTVFALFVQEEGEGAEPPPLQKA